MKQQPTTFNLCCGGKKCPEVSCDAQANWSIKDDFGGEVKLTDGQIRELVDHPHFKKSIAENDN